MTDNVVKFFAANAYEDFNNVLEQAVGEYSEGIIIGYNKDGSFDIRCNEGMDASDLLIMIEKFKFKLMRGDYSEE